MPDKTPYYVLCSFIAQVIDWTSSGVRAASSQVNVALYKGNARVMTLNKWNGVIVPMPSSSFLRWIVMPSLIPGNDYYIRFERIGQSSSYFAVDSDMFSITYNDVSGSGKYLFAYLCQNMLSTL